MEFIILFVLGVCVGSFLNVLADRLPSEENIFLGRSHCDWCRKPLRWFELIPVVSFVLQTGRCRRCKRSLSIAYPIVEGITGFAFAWFWFQSGSTVSYVYALCMFSVFLVLFVADVKYQILPDSVIAAGILMTLLYGFFVMDWRSLALPHLLSGAATTGLFFLIWLGTRGKGIGFGDVKLVFLLGLFLGYPGIVIALYIAFLTGAGVGVILMITHLKTLKSKIAFGPFLIAGTVATWYGNVWFTDLWRRWIGL